MEYGNLLISLGKSPAFLKRAVTGTNGINFDFSNPSHFAGISNSDGGAERGDGRARMGTGAAPLPREPQERGCSPARHPAPLQHPLPRPLILFFPSPCFFFQASDAGVMFPASCPSFLADKEPRVCAGVRFKSTAWHGDIAARLREAHPRNIPVTIGAKYM